MIIVDFGGGEIRLKSIISHCALCEARLNQEAAFYPFADKFVCVECKAGLATAKAITEY